MTKGFRQSLWVVLRVSQLEQGVDNGDLDKSGRALGELDSLLLAPFFDEPHDRRGYELRDEVP